MTKPTDTTDADTTGPSKPRPDVRNIYQRMNAVMQEVDYIQKEKKQGMRYSIVSHDAVTAKVRPLMVKHGIIYFPVGMAMEQNGNRTQMNMTVRFQNVDYSSDYMDVVTAGYGIDDQDKGPGKAISYSVKYALLKALGLESGDDPDEDQAVVHKAKDEQSIEAMIDLAASIDELTAIGNTIAQKVAAKEITELQRRGLTKLYAERKALLNTARQLREGA
jgi:hypothetical protein